MPGGFRQFANEINSKQGVADKMPTFDNFKNTYKTMGTKVRNKDNDDGKWMPMEKTKEQ